MKLSVVGSINMDQVVQADRIPLKGETIHGDDLQFIPGGKGANQAVAMARLGSDVSLFGCVGNDPNGHALLQSLKENHVNVDSVQILDGVQTGIAIITVAEQDNTIVIVAGANDQVTTEYIDQISPELLKSDLVLLQHEIPQETVEYVIDLCQKHGVKTLLNPAPARAVREEVIEKLSYLTPNEHEVKLIFPELTLEEALKKYPEKLIVSLGSQGVAAYDGNEIIQVPARKSHVVDTTGAGDTMNAAFAVKISEGATIEEALKFANTAAGLSTEKLGAQSAMPTKKEVLEEMDIK